MELLYAFVDFLATKDPAFKGIDHTALRTTFKGVAQIYDMLRKRVEKTTPKTPMVATRQTQKKVTPQKSSPEPAEASESAKQIKDTITKITGDYLGPGTDEK